MQIIRTIIYISFLLISLLFIGCKDNKKTYSTELVHIPVSAEGKNDKTAMPKFKFETTEHDFGTLMQGEKVSFTYKFINVGSSDLIISTVVPSCGCTVAQFTETPVKSGGDGFVTINFNTENKKGFVKKHVTIEANTYPAESKLWFLATVELP